MWSQYQNQVVHKIESITDPEQIFFKLSTLPSDEPCALSPFKNKTNVAKLFDDISTHAKKMCLSNSANDIESYNTMRG